MEYVQEMLSKNETENEEVYVPVDANYIQGQYTPR